MAIQEELPHVLGQWMQAPPYQFSIQPWTQRAHTHGMPVLYGIHLWTSNVFCALKKKKNHPVPKKRYENVTCTQELPQQSNDIIADMQTRELEVQLPLRIVWKDRTKQQGSKEYLLALQRRAWTLSQTNHQRLRESCFRENCIRRDVHPSEG